MDKKEFFDFIKENISDYLPRDCEKIQLGEVTKNNNQHFTGLSIRREGENIAPNIYLDDFFTQYEQGQSIHEILQTIAKIRLEVKIPEMDVDSIANYKEMKYKLQIRMCDPELNENMLKDMPYTMHGDYAATYYLKLVENQEENGVIRVNDKLMESWGIGVDELHADAMSIEMNKHTPVLINVEDVMMHMLIGKEERNLFETFSENTAEIKEQPTMFVLTNNEKDNGANVILQSHILEKAGDILETNYFLLPSSIHEWLLVPDDGLLQVNELETMVQEVNATEVSLNEQLSDKVQYYDKDTKVLENARNHEARLEKTQDKETSKEEKKSIHSRLEDKKEESKTLSVAKSQPTKQKSQETSL